MKQKIFLSIAILSLLSLAVFVSAVNPPSLPGETTKDIPGYGSITGNYVESSFKFMNGWNLIHGLPNPEWLSGGDLEASNIKAIYGFNPITQEYIRFYPQPEKNKLSSQNTRVDSMISATAFWVYIDAPTEYGESEYWTLEPNEELNKQLVEGWNFVGFLPNYVGKSFDELKGNCDIQKLYWWQPRSQQFNNILSDKDRMEVLRYSENIGSGLLIKVPESCTLFTSSSDSSGVPNVPEIPNIKECGDSDGGTVIDVKGKTGYGSDLYNDVCFIKESETETTSTPECSGNDCYLKEYHCDSQTGNAVSDDFLCSERGFTSCKEGACSN
tara:strand:- start:15 stop:995 length:981 start_codon:yes stop_codon:yes gene_type:complete